jgi:hypothetical protein
MAWQPEIQEIAPTEQTSIVCSTLGSIAGLRTNSRPVSSCSSTTRTNVPPRGARFASSHSNWSARRKWTCLGCAQTHSFSLCDVTPSTKSRAGRTER